jgi:hypothetical protein
LTAKRLGKKFLKIVGISLGSLLILLTAFHFWFVHHAEDILEALVESKSGGKIKLEVKKFKFNWFSNKIELTDAVFYTTDSVNTGTSYRFAVKKINLKVKAVWPIVFQKTVHIRTLSLQNPDIVVTMLRSSSRGNTRKDSTGSSIPQEMGRVYKSIQDAIQVLQVKKFEIENATFTLINKIRSDQLPVTIGKIDFHIDNLLVDTAQFTGKEKLFFSDNIVLKSRDQDILFPNGRHRLTYRKFRINIEKKIVELDSCTIAAVKTDSSSTGFSVYFDALQLTNIDFDTLYRSEVIKADSVYCINPTFKLEVDMDKRKANRKKAPKLDQIIRQLTGDMFLNFVVVNNASFDIKTLRNGRPSSFTSKGNNFEMQGLRIDNDAKRPLRVEKFAMAIRNYETFLRDSTYEMQFDSVMVNDDKILLNDFSFRQLANGKTVNSFKVPRFQLTGLSWDDLLFEKKLTAQRAILFSPVIKYTEPAKKSTAQKRRNIFDALADMNQVIMLEDLNIVDGDIDLHLNGGIDMQLKDATLSVESRSLLGSSHLAGIRRSVNYLDFNKGVFKINDLTILMDHINYTGANSLLNAEHVLVNNSSNTTAAEAKGVTMNGIFINENTGDISISKIGWQEADINLSELRSPGQSKGASFMSLTDINGNNTRITSALGHKKAVAFIDHVSATAFLLKPGERPIIAGLLLTGKDVSVSDSLSQISVGSFTISDEKNALLENINYRNYAGNDSTEITIPRLSFIPDVQSAINGDIRAREMIVTQPLIRIHMSRAGPVVNRKEMRLPKGNINKIFIDQPAIDLSQQTEKGTISIKWNGKNVSGNSITLADAVTGDSAFSAKQLDLSLNSFVVENSNGKNFDAGKSEIKAVLNDISFYKNKNEKAGWQATLTTLDGKNFLLDSIGKKAGKLDIKTIGLQDLAITSLSVGSIRTLLEENKKFRLQQVTASYTDTVNQFYWFNAGYDKGNKLFTLDSFIYNPTEPRDLFVANHPYQTDYINVKTGSMRIGPFDIDGYLRDSIARAGTMKINDIVFTDFRDKRKPYKAGAIKELMVNRIKKIPFKLSVDTILLENGRVTYTELNPKTGETGTIPVTRMTVRLFPIRNYDLAATDSLRIQANGYLMDSIWLRLRLRESYIDSLAGFLLTVRMKPADIRILNPVLGPLASARIRSGYLDTLNMRVGGNEYLAYGEMKMLYHKLKIQLLKNGSPKKAGFLSFLANSFIIRDRNTKRTGDVFFVRNRERSALNFLIKIFLSGVKSTIGLKSNRKIMRDYKKELKERNLPPVDYD